MIQPVNVWNCTVCVRVCVCELEGQTDKRLPECPDKSKFQKRPTEANHSSSNSCFDQIIFIQ